MARDGLFALLCAGAVCVTGLVPPTLAAPGDDRDSMVAATLAVQTAMQQAREFLSHNDSKAAVRVLEEQLSRINGHPAYLTLLRDAYRSYVKELRLAGQEAEAKRILQRLLILDPGAALDGGITRGANAPAALPTAKSIPTAPAKPPATVRGIRGEETDDPFHERYAVQLKPAKGLVARAEAEFNNHRYREAAALFEQAHRADAASVVASRERWAYCILYRVVEAVKEPAPGVAWDELENETRQAVAMAPRIQYGPFLLEQIKKRRAAQETPPVAVRHLGRDASGWEQAETANFRILHNQPREVAEQVAQVAERTRLTMSRKWFGGFKQAWSPRCDLYLHATSGDYSRATGVPTSSPGHSSIRTDGGRVISRRIDLHCDDVKNMVRAVLPHEATHVVIAGQFGEQQIPRWADEGMAVLTEPREKVEMHLKNLGKCRQESQLFPIRQLMQMADYPDPRYITAFYAQSVSLVEFLSVEKGPQVFTQFLREAMRDGYEPSLRRHFGYRNFDELQQKWDQKAFAATAVNPPTVVQGGR